MSEQQARFDVLVQQWLDETGPLSSMTRHLLVARRIGDVIHVGGAAVLTDPGPLLPLLLDLT